MLACPSGVDVSSSSLRFLTHQLRQDRRAIGSRRDALPIDRIAADRPFYSGKHKKHGMNVKVLTDPLGRRL